MGLSHGQVMLIYMVLCGTFGLVGMINSETTFVSPLVKLLVMVVMALVLAAIAVYISRRRFDREDSVARASRGVQASSPDN
ncbi:MAG: hypothetical protein QOH93_2476, partial [Chloroflexia bacterium]|jgi:membrane protein implicated in regulation of membrane protease activity|nr:hypothetical protein [Chloroflexia bacterium]